MITFTPLADFYSPEISSHYVKGLQYTVRDDNLKLGALVRQWLEQGMVVISESVPSAKIGGTGIITNPEGVKQNGSHTSNRSKNRHR